MYEGNGRILTTAQLEELAARFDQDAQASVTPQELEGLKAAIAPAPGIQGMFSQKRVRLLRKVAARLGLNADPVMPYTRRQGRFMA